MRQDKLIRERIIDLPRELERSGADPFLVDVKDLLEKLKRRRRDVELLKLDSKALNSVSKIVEMQEKWVVDALKGLRVDPDLVREKIKKLSLKEISSVLSKNFYPIIGLKRISIERLRDGLVYWEIVRPWGSYEEPAPIAYKDLATEPLSLTPESVKEKANKLYVELTPLLEKGPIDYRSYLSRFPEKERLEKAFLLGYLATIGKIALKKEPLTKTILILKPGKGEPFSIAIEVSEIGRGRGA